MVSDVRLDLQIKLLFFVVSKATERGLAGAKLSKPLIVP
jgi:hypothetical protein